MTLNQRLKIARSELGKSVIEINPFLERDLQDKEESVLCFGVKNTSYIPMHIFEKLRTNKKFLWLTIDKMSDKGRSIDTDLINPLTYRLMTGSTSGGAINILKGINDFAIGSDGGGSILGPAMSCQLPAIIGAGLGVYVNNESLSTDKIKLRGSVGVIAKKLNVVIEVFEEIIGKSLQPLESNVLTNKKLKVVIPKKGTVITPTQEDMYNQLQPYLDSLDNNIYSFEEVDFTGIEKREVAIKKIQEVFDRWQADIIITHEGPVDVYGYGETIPQMFNKPGKDITKNNGKYLLKAANICKTTAITIPTANLASGILIIAKYGFENAVYAINLAKKIESLITLPEVFVRYFLTDERYDAGFSL